MLRWSEFALKVMSIPELICDKFPCGRGKRREKRLSKRLSAVGDACSLRMDLAVATAWISESADHDLCVSAPNWRELRFLLALENLSTAREHKDIFVRS
jgi:hypothetical protein